MFELLNFLTFFYHINILDEISYNNAFNNINIDFLDNIIVYINYLLLLNFSILGLTYKLNKINKNYLYFFILVCSYLKYVHLNINLIIDNKNNYLSFLFFNIQMLMLKGIYHNFFINFSCKMIKLFYNIFEKIGFITSYQANKFNLITILGLLCYDSINDFYNYYYHCKIFYLFYYASKQKWNIVFNILIYYSFYFGKIIYRIYKFFNNFMGLINVFVISFIRNFGYILSNIENMTQNINLNRIIVNNTNNIVFEKSKENICKNENCVICFTNNIDTKFDDCEHNIICLNCSRKIDKCPICRKEIKKIYY
jgi:hypothetical protein